MFVCSVLSSLPPGPRHTLHQQRHTQQQSFILPLSLQKIKNKTQSAPHLTLLEESKRAPVVFCKGSETDRPRLGAGTPCGEEPRHYRISELKINPDPKRPNHGWLIGCDHAVTLNGYLLLRQEQYMMCNSWPDR